jgi:hypothetical protein
MKRADLLPALLAGLAALMGGGWLVIRHFHTGFHPQFLADGAWLLLVLLFLAGVSLIAFLAYAFAFVNSSTIAVI